MSTPTLSAARFRCLRAPMSALMLSCILLTGIASPVAAQNHGPSVNITSRHMSPPRYPMSAVQEGADGTVHLRVMVAASGKLTDVEVEHSSGHQSLDSAAMDAARRWTYTPASKDGKPTAGIVRIPVNFHLDP